jgi:hypothetical protein
MRRVLLLLGVALLALGAVTPVLEAVVPCAEPCLDETEDGQCASDQCCSCCVHSRLVTADRSVPADPLAPACPMATAPTRLPGPADPREILHVPKPAFA